VKNKPKTKNSRLTIHTQISHNCDTPGWRFNVYVSPSGSNGLQQQIDKLSPEIEQSFKVRIRYLSNTPKQDWKRPHAAKLQGVEEIYEIRFKANRVEMRPLGFFGPQENEFTILIWAAKKEDIYEPPNAIKTAESRRKEIIRQQASCLPLQIDGEEFPVA
jgi:hypothetical protein